MKKIGIVFGAVVFAMAVAYFFGYFSQRSAVQATQTALTACQDGSAKAADQAKANLGLLELYRARAELTRSNWGSAGDALARAKGHFGAEAYASARADIDKTTAVVLKQEAASSDEIGALIKALEAKGLPATP